MTIKRGPLIVCTAAVFALLTLMRFEATRNAEPSQPELFAETAPPLRVQSHKTSAKAERQSLGPKQVTRPVSQRPLETLMLAIAGSSAPSPALREQTTQRGELINLTQLETEHDFQALATAMRQTSSAEATEKQRAYEADFAAFPEAAHGVRVKDFSCDEHNCIGQISAKQQYDIDKFMLTAATATRYPIYTAQQVVVEDETQALRRFAFSTDANRAELELPEAEPAAISGAIQITR